MWYSRHWCYYWHTLRDSVSPVGGILYCPFVPANKIAFRKSAMTQTGRRARSNEKVNPIQALQSAPKHNVLNKVNSRQCKLWNIALRSRKWMEDTVYTAHLKLYTTHQALISALCILNPRNHTVHIPYAQ